MDTVEKNWKQVKEAIETCTEKHIPRKKIGKHHDVPWMTTEIKRLIRKNNAYTTTARKARNHHTKSVQRHQKLN